MRTRRDQVQAYRFVIRRIVSAMLSGEPEASERPMRRLGWSVFASTMVTVLVMAIAGIWGLVTSQGRELSDPSLVINADTKARYVYVEGRLHPVQNIASARLILGTDDPEEREVPSSTLEGIARGHPAGIIGAPDGLPAADQLAGLPWRVCSVPPRGDARQPTTTVVAGVDIPGGQDPGREGVYIAVDDQEYLLWDDRALQITHRVVPVTLGLSAEDPTPVNTPLLNAIPAGPDLDVVRPDEFGEITEYRINDEMAGVGYIYATAGQHYIMTAEGLRPIGEFTVALRTTIGAAQIREITGGEVTVLQQSSQSLEPPGYPLEVPQLHPASSDSPVICVRYEGPSDDDRPAGITELHEQVPTQLTAADSLALLQTEQDVVAAADELLLPSGQGALVQEATVRGTAADESTVYLITPEGTKHRIGGQQAQAALGYGDVDPTPVPADLLAVIPTGVPLTIEAAREVIDGSVSPG